MDNMEKYQIFYSDNEENCCMSRANGAYIKCTKILQTEGK